MNSENTRGINPIIVNNYLTTPHIYCMCPPFLSIFTLTLVTPISYIISVTTIQYYTIYYIYIYSGSGLHLRRYHVSGGNLIVSPPTISKQLLLCSSRRRPSLDAGLHRHTSLCTRRILQCMSYTTNFILQYTKHQSYQKPISTKISSSFFLVTTETY